MMPPLLLNIVVIDHICKMYEQICLAALPLYYALHRGYENAEATGFRLFR